MVFNDIRRFHYSRPQIHILKNVSLSLKNHIKTIMILCVFTIELLIIENKII